MVFLFKVRSGEHYVKFFQRFSIEKDEGYYGAVSNLPWQNYHRKGKIMNG